MCWIATPSGKVTQEHVEYTGLHRGFFPSSSAGKESVSNAGIPSWIPGSGRSPGERIDYPLQYSWASLRAQTVKNPPAMRETWVPALGWEDSLLKGMATHSPVFLPGESHGQRSLAATVHGVTKSRTQLSNFCLYFFTYEHIANKNFFK